MENFEKLLAIVRRKAVYDRNNPWYKGPESYLHGLKDEVDEVKTGVECGIRLGDFNEYEVGDVIECYRVEQVKLRFTGEGAAEAKRWRFHPGQVVTPQEDGSLLVEFETGGMLELAWHLFTWRTQVEILSPARLREVMVEELQAALARHAQAIATEAVVDAVQA